MLYAPHHLGATTSTGTFSASGVMCTDMFRKCFPLSMLKVNYYWTGWQVWRVARLLNLAV